MHTNCYMVLGISPDANLSQIKRAYRQRCHECHPDHDSAGEERFHAIKTAYETLSDPKELAEHDRKIGRSPRQAHPAHHVDVIRDFETHRPSLDEILALMRGATRAKSVHERPLTIEMVLSRDEAAYGTTLAIDIPIFAVCPACHGEGRSKAGLGICEECDGSGRTQQCTRVDVIVPRNTPDGTTIPVSLRHLGMRHLYLQVQVRVA